MVGNKAGKQPSIRRIAGVLRWILLLASAASLTTAIVLVSHRNSAAPATVLFVLTPVLLLVAASVERAVPRLLSEPLRTLMRQNLADGEAIRTGAKLFRRGSGVPKRTAHVEAGGPVGEPVAARPKAIYQLAATEVLWTGDGLAVTDQRGRVTRWRTGTGGVASDFLPAALKSPRRVPTAPPTGDAVVAGIVVARIRRQLPETLVLIDRRSRRVGSVPILGFEEKDLARVARRAGIEFSAYVLPARFGQDGETLTAAMFPRSVLFQRVAGVHREWGPLSPLQKFLHFWLALVTDPLQTPPTSRRAMREAAKRPM
jgi:hypothetical protein